MITGLDHVQLAIPRGGEEQARVFYGGVLGMTEVPKPPALAVRGGVWFVAGRAHLHLGVDDGFRPARKAHPALLVTDLAEVARALVAGGVTVMPDTSVEGVRRIYAEDPFGNRLELIQAGDGFSER